MQNSFIIATEIWEPNREKTELTLVNGHYGSFEEFKQESYAMNFKYDEGLPGKAWSQKYPIILKSFEGEALVIGADDFQESDLIKQGMKENHLRAECVDNRLALYVNGELLIETYDSDIPEGDIGFIVGTVSAETTEILFDNIEIYEP